MIYDIEVLPNVFTMCLYNINTSSFNMVEVSPWKNDIQLFYKVISHLQYNNYILCGFNNYHYDYPVIHHLFTSSVAASSVEAFTDEAYRMSKRIIGSKTPWENTVFDSKMVVPQMDLFKIHHFDNKAKTASLKRLEFNMRRKSIVEFSVPFDDPLTNENLYRELISYNQEDVDATYEFFKHSKAAIDFRESLVNEFGMKALNFNDTKIGEVLITNKLIESVGEDALYIWETDPITERSRRKPRQSPCDRFKIKDVLINNKMSFVHPEFKEVYKQFSEMDIFNINGQLHWSKEDDYREGIKEIERQQGRFKRLKSRLPKGDPQLGRVADKIKESQSKYNNNPVTATLGGMEFVFARGGLHASHSFRIYKSTKDKVIRDVDVSSMYPSIAISYGMKPGHLPPEFVRIYEQMRNDRISIPKSDPRNLMLKLALNGTYGKSNSVFSLFYDPKYTMKTTLNGQLFLAMLWDRLLLKVPGIEIIQANTDGITYIVDRDKVDICKAVEAAWEKHVLLELESVEYSAMYIRDVNNYIAVKAKDNSLKLKGAYCYTELFDGDNAKSTRWHKNHSNVVSIKAAVNYLAYGTDIKDFIENHDDIYDFCHCTNVNRSCHLLWGEERVQRNTRFIVTYSGEQFTKVMPPLPKNPEKWREIAVCKGYNVTPCNNMDELDVDSLDINYDYYIDEAEKLTREFGV